MKSHSKYNKEQQKAFVDIDETICFFDGDRIYENAIPNYDNIKKINKLYEDGWYITYWTSRGGLCKIDYYSITKEQLDNWGCKYHHVSVGEKPLYDLVIDDKAKRIEEL